MRNNVWNINSHKDNLTFLLLNVSVLTRVPVVGECGSPLLLPLHPGPEDGHQTARRWRIWGEGGQTDEEMWTEHFSNTGSQSVWHAGKMMTPAEYHRVSVSDGSAWFVFFSHQVLYVHWQSRWCPAFIYPPRIKRQSAAVPLYQQTWWLPDS